MKYIQQFDVTGNAKIQSFKFRRYCLPKADWRIEVILHHTLEALFNTAHPEFTNYYKVFFLADVCPGTAGVALLNTKLTIVFTPRNPATTVHELLHAVGLPHSWEKGNKNSDINGFIFEKFKTDNVMDYSKNRYSLWKWQWKKLQSNCNHHQCKP